MGANSRHHPGQPKDDPALRASAADHVISAAAVTMSVGGWSESNPTKALPRASCLPRPAGGKTLLMRFQLSGRPVHSGLPKAQLAFDLPRLTF